MPTVISQGSLTDANFWETWPRAGAIQASNRWMDYAAIYRTQPNVRTMVDFVARNIAQLGLHVYQRVDENDRKRLRDAPVALLLDKPNPWTTRHRAIYSVMADRGIYGQSFWLKVKGGGLGNFALLRVPPMIVTVKGGLVPTGYEVHFTNETKTYDPSQVVHFRNYNPDSPVTGLSPIESLRQILDEDLAAIDHRSDMWSNAGRQPVILKRPKSAGQWAPEVAKRFTELFTEAFRDPKSRTTPLLEDDMDLEVLSFNAEQSQYAEARKLTMQQVATAYHVPLSMAGIDGAPSTFASVREFRKSLYVDTLGPWIDDLESDIALQLFPDFDNMDGVYAEFNIFEKLQGSFEDQADLLQKLVGRPLMTPDEGRAKLNLPSMGGDATQLAVPLNIDPSGGDGAENSAAINAARQRIFARQQTASQHGQPWNTERWNRELMTDLAAAGVAYPLAVAQEINELHRAQLEAWGGN